MKIRICLSQANGYSDTLAYIKETIPASQIGKRFSNSPIRQLYGQPDLAKGDDVFVRHVPARDRIPERWLIIEVYNHNNRYQTQQIVVDMTSDMASKHLKFHRALTEGESKRLSDTVDSVRYMM